MKKKRQKWERDIRFFFSTFFVTLSMNSHLSLNNFSIYPECFFVEWALWFSSFAFLLRDASLKIIRHHTLSLLPHFSDVIHSYASASCCFIVCATCCVIKGQSSGKRGTWHGNKVLHISTYLPALKADEAKRVPRSGGEYVSVLGCRCY